MLSMTNLPAKRQLPARPPVPTRSATGPRPQASAQPVVEPESGADDRTPLLRLYDFLNALDLRVNWRGVSPQQPFEQVIITLDPGEQAPLRPEYVLQIAFAEAIQAGMQGWAVNHQHGATLLFSLVLPVQIPPELRLEAYRLLALLNRILPLGHLGLHEGVTPALVFFKYPLAALSTNISMLLVQDIIEQINTFVLLMTPALQQFSRAQQSADEARELIESLLIEQARTLYLAVQAAQHTQT